jgi:hypothetical protein
MAWLAVPLTMAVIAGTAGQAVSAAAAFAGIQIIAPNGPGTVTDAAGSVGARAGFCSGTPLPALSAPGIGSLP